jgi:SOS-response transcriptional repressor LexA
LFLFEVIVAELNIKQEIGKRILEARKAKGLTLKALGELAGDLKQTRLTNWEQGTRTPGPEEIKQLAQALEVSPAYLMCLSDEQEPNKAKPHRHLLPLLDAKQACDAKTYLESSRDDIKLIAVSTELLPNLSDNAFVLRVTDDSMMPEFRVNDVLVIEPDATPKPGDYVVAFLKGEQEVLIRKYKQLSASKDVNTFELAALNDDWASIGVDAKHLQGEVVGKVVQKIKQY